MANAASATSGTPQHEASAAGAQTTASAAAASRAAVSARAAAPQVPRITAVAKAEVKAEVKAKATAEVKVEAKAEKALAEHAEAGGGRTDGAGNAGANLGVSVEVDVGVAGAGDVGADGDIYPLCKAFADSGYSPEQQLVVVESEEVPKDVLDVMIAKSRKRPEPSAAEAAAHAQCRALRRATQLVVAEIRAERSWACISNQLLRSAVLVDTATA